jgi:hypothetical protein
LRDAERARERRRWTAHFHAGLRPIRLGEVTREEQEIVQDTMAFIRTALIGQKGR